MQTQLSAVEKHRKLILDAHDFLWAHPETGYREEASSKYLEDEYERLGCQIVRAGDIPGFYTVIDTGRQGPELLILAELDSLICPTHKDADPKTGAVHCCGHSAQNAALLGIAAALREPGSLDGLSGRIRLCAVPAEEYIEIEFRKTLKRQGRIKYLCGKSEFLHRGLFDGVDLAFMVHTADSFQVQKGSNGCIAKKITYKGVSAHAGGAPWMGCNALYAANLGLSAVNAIRETFKEPDQIRVHPIITRGGDAVNAIPAQVVLETFIRGKSFEAISETNEKVNRALCGAALSLGANIEIEDTPGYSPLINDDNMMETAAEAMQIALPDEKLTVGDNVTPASTDMGDLSTLMPVVHPYAAGQRGTPHGADYAIESPELACVASAKWQMAMLVLLLSDDARRAKQILREFKPIFKSKEEYFKYIDAFNSNGEKISYGADGTASVSFK